MKSRAEEIISKYFNRENENKELSQSIISLYERIQTQNDKGCKSIQGMIRRGIGREAFVNSVVDILKECGYTVNVNPSWIFYEIHISWN